MRLLQRLSPVPPLWFVLITAFLACSAYAGTREGRQENPGLVISRKQPGPNIESVEDLRWLLQRDPSNVGIRMQLSDVLQQAGLPGEAAALLEAGAQYSHRRASGLYLAAARLREKMTQFGQALLDYRAFLSSADPSVASSGPLNRHILYLSMLLSGASELPRLPVVRELGAEGALAGLPLHNNFSRPGHDAGDPNLVIPGGLDLLARALGIIAPDKEDPDALRQLLSGMEVPGAKSKISPLSQRALLHLQTMDGLMDHLRTRGLLPSDLDPARGINLVLPLEGDPPSVERTEEFLSFFGIRLKRKGGEPRFFFLRSDKAAQRRWLLKNLDIDVSHPDQTTMHLSIRDEKVTIMPDRDFWFGLLGKKGDSPRNLLERLLASPRGIRLYLALASCSESARAALMKAAAPRELVTSADILAALGSCLDFKNGDLILPGSQDAWEGLLAVPYSQAGRFLLRLLQLDGGQALVLYAALSAAGSDVQHYFASSPERFGKLYECMKPYTLLMSENIAAEMGARDLVRTMRQFSVRDGDLILSGDPRVGPYLLSATGSRFPKLTLRELPDLLNFRIKMLPDSYYRGDTLELINLLRFSRPEVLSDRNLSAITADPAETAGALGLIWDLNLPAGLMSEYLDYCRMLARAGVSWNIDRIRSSQSLFHLISLLRKENAVNDTESARLLEAALESLRPEDEADFALDLARFLSNRLLPVLRHSSDGPASADELVFKSLGGSLPARVFAFEGRRLRFDASANRLQRMKSTISQQRYTPLSVLLELYHLLDGIISGRSTGIAAGHSAVRLLAQMIPAQPSSDEAKSQRQGVAGIDLKAFLAEWSASAQSGESLEGLRRRARKLAAALHPELGVTLLAFCYAYYGSPADDTLIFDVNFVRRHDFRSEREFGRLWRRAQLGLDAGMASFVQGSISGLGYVLARLEKIQPMLTLSEKDSLLLPDLLAGVRAESRGLRTERAQEYVALLTRLGREVLVLGALDKRLGAWSGRALSGIIPPQRRECIRKALVRLDTQAIARHIYPSELFSLGESYLDSVTVQDRLADPMKTGAAPQLRVVPHIGFKDDFLLADGRTRIPVITSPVLDRLREIASAAAKSDPGAFVKEVEQFGIPQQIRLGLGAFSLLSPEPYETLDRPVDREVLFERICDLKMRIADLNYALNIPAYLAGLETGPALRDVLSGSEAASSRGWMQVLDGINRLTIDDARSWIEEALERGWLQIADGNETSLEADIRQ